MGVRVDEARGHDHARGIDDTSRSSFGEVANCLDLFSDNAHIGSKFGSSGAVDHRATNDDYVEHYLLRRLLDILPDRPARVA